jgi:hypothetical protein
LIDVATSSLRYRLEAPNPAVKQLTFSPDGAYLGALSADQRNVLVWKAVEGSAPVLVARPNKVESLAIFPGGQQIALGDETGAVVLVDVATGVAIRELPTAPIIEELIEDKKAEAAALAISPSGRWLSAVLGGLLVCVFDLTIEGPVKIRAVTGLRVSSTAFSPDGKYLLAQGGNISISITVSGNDPRVAVTDLAGGLLVWDVAADESKFGRTEGVMFEGAFWSADASQIVVITNGSRGNRGLKKAVKIFARDAIRDTGALPFAALSVGLGEGPAYASSAFATTSATLFMEQAGAMRAWAIPLPSALEPTSPDTAPTAVGSAPAPRTDAPSTGLDWAKTLAGNGPVRTRINNRSSLELTLRIRNLDGQVVAQIGLPGQGRAMLYLPRGSLESVIRVRQPEGEASYYRGPAIEIPQDGAELDLALEASNLSNLTPIAEP